MPTLSQIGVNTQTLSCNRFYDMSKSQKILKTKTVTKAESLVGVANLAV